MYWDLICWDFDDDIEGNVWHIAAGGVTPEEVEEVLRNHRGAPDAFSKTTGHPMVVGTTSTGKRIEIVY
jgi:hypothetical protein